MHLLKHCYYASNTLSCITVLMCHDAGDDDDDVDDDRDDDARFVADQGASRLVDGMSHEYTKLARKSVWLNL